VELSSLRGHQGDVQVVAWSPDNAKIASGGSSDGTARIWDVATGRELHRLAHNDVGVWSLAWNPDGTRIYSWAGDRTMRTWDAAKGTCLEENRESSAEFGDLVAQARGAERHPYRAFATKNGSVIQEAVSGRAIAWYPVDLVLASSPSGRAWGGGDGNDLYILGLEGIDYAGPPSSGGENRRESGERRDPPTSQPRWSRWTRWLGWKKK
jgi:WD40 repeat protein